MFPDNTTYNLAAPGATIPSDAVSGPTRPLKQRPLGVTIYAGVAGLGGLMLLFGGLAFMGLGALGGAFLLGGFFGGGLFGGLLFAIGGVLFLALGLGYLAVAWGSWNGSPWAWTVAIVLCFATAVVELLSLPTGIVGVLIQGFLVWYFTREGVQRWYGKVGAWPAPQVNDFLARVGAPR
jgi:hypothetical protein